MSILPTSDHLSSAKMSTIDFSLTESSSIQEGVVENRENVPEISLVDTISLHAKSFFSFLVYTVPMGLYFAVKQVVLFPFSVTVYLVKQVTQLFWQAKTQPKEQQFSDPGIQYTDRVKTEIDRELKTEFMGIIEQELSEIDKGSLKKILDDTSERIELRLTKLLGLENTEIQSLSSPASPEMGKVQLQKRLDDASEKIGLHITNTEVKAASRKGLAEDHQIIPVDHYELQNEPYLEGDQTKIIKQDLTKQLKDLKKELQYRKNILENEKAILEAQEKESIDVILGLIKELINRIHKERGFALI